MDDHRLKVGTIHTVHKHKLIFVAEFVEKTDVYHIAEQSNKWVVLKGGDHSAIVCSSITEQVMEVLKLLPNKPYHHQPFMQYLSRQ